jgi:hypothetical protein
VIAGVATVALVLGGAVAYFALFPDQAPAFVRTTLASVGIVEPAPADRPTCPLTGEVAPRAGVPDRPALAIKVENSPESRPQAALNEADIVVEEPVEGGYTRFIVIYQCDHSGRVGPVRSARTTDPKYLQQLGPVVFGYAGGVHAVTAEIAPAGLVDANYVDEAQAYTRDESRSAPHNLYTKTNALWKAARSDAGPPAPLFVYADAWEGRAKRVGGVHLPFSSASDVRWVWSRSERAWMRSHGESPHVLEDGEQVSAGNVVIQVVTVTESDIIDAAGNPSPEVELTGSGRAYVLRDGRLIVGRWERDSLSDVTRFVAKDGTEITLAPGRTWVELLPSWVEVERLPR